jgi:hypothetical protein
MKMRINDSLLRKSVRAVITEAFGFTSGIEGSDMAFFEKIWDRLMVIVNAIEASLIENRFDDVLAGARKVRDDLIERHGDIRFDPDRFPGSDLLMNTEFFTSRIQDSDPSYASEMKQIDSIMNLMYKVLIKKSSKIDPERSDRGMQILRQDMSNYVKRMIVRHVSALAVEALTGEEMPGWTVPARNNPRFNLRQMLNNAVYWTQFTGD